MKKKKFIVILPLVLILFGALVFIFKFSPQLIIREEIDMITVRNGTTGDKAQITNKQEIAEIVDTINEYGLNRMKSISSQTGWSIILDLEKRYRQQTMSLVLRENGIEYENYFYGSDDQVSSLLASFEKMFNR